MSEQEIDPEEFKTAAARAGLTLTDNEATEAVTGANRWRRAAQQARKHVTPDTQPAPTFAPLTGGTDV